MAILTLEQVGWKKVCPINVDYIEGIKRILHFAGYETVESDKKYLLCKPLIPEDSKPKQFIYLASCLTKDNYSKWQGIISSLNFFINTKGAKHHQANIANPENFIKKFLEGEDYNSFRAFTSLLTVTHPNDLQNVLRDLAVPSFFKKHQNGKIYFICIDDNLLTINSAVRVLSDADIFGVELFKKSKDIRKDVPRSMRMAHHTGIDAFSEIALTSVLAGFFPYIYGFVVSRVGGYIILLLDKPIKLEHKLQQFDYLRESGIFDDLKGTVDLEKLQALIREKEMDYRIAYKRYIHESEFSIDEMDIIIRWTITHLNKFYIKLLNICGFSNKNDYIDFTYHRKVFLTLERIFIEISNIIFQHDSFIRKILYFDMHDKISNLMVTSSLSKTKISKRLLRLSHFESRIKSILQNLPPPFNDYIIKYGKEIYETIISTTTDGIWDESRKTDKGIVLREMDDTYKDGWIGTKYTDAKTKIDYEEYTINALNEYRNTLHGYILRDNKYEKFLSINKGTISDYLPDLSLIWLYVMLDDINKVLHKDIARTS